MNIISLIVSLLLFSNIIIKNVNINDKVENSGSNVSEVFDNSEFKNTFKKIGEITLKSTDKVILAGISKLKIDQNKIFVLDGKLKQFVIYDKNGNPLQVVNKTGKGPDEFLRVTDFAINSSGNIFIVDVGNHKVLKYDSNLNFIHTNKIVFGSRIGDGVKDDFYIYRMEEPGGSKNNVVFHYDANGKLQKEFCPVFWDIPFSFSGNGIITKDESNYLYLTHPSKYLIRKIDLKNYSYKDFSGHSKSYQQLKVVKGKLASQDELDTFTPISGMAVTSKYILVEYYHAKSKKRWIDILNKNGQLVISSLETNFKFYLSSVDKDDNIYFIEPPDEENISSTGEVPDYKILIYKLKL